MAFCFLLGTVTWADESSKPEEKPPLPELKEIVVFGPYCGIYSKHCSEKVYKTCSETVIPAYA